MANKGESESEIDSLKREMGNVIGEMIRCHSTDVQTLKQSHQNVLEEQSLLNKNVIETLAAKLEKGRKYYCGQISRLKDDFEELKESHQREIISLKALYAEKTEQKENVIRTEAVEIIAQLKEQLAEQVEKFDEQMTKKSQFHTENVQNILRKYELKRMQSISDLKGVFEIQTKAHAVELKRLTTETEMLKKSCAAMEHFKAQPNIKRAKRCPDQFQTKNEQIILDLRQKLNRKSVACEQTINSLDEQKIQLQMELKKSEKLRKSGQRRISEIEKIITELKHERLALTNEINRLKRVEQSHKYLAERHTILYNENENLESAHQQLRQVSETQTHFCSGYLKIFRYSLMSVISR